MTERDVAGTIGPEHDAFAELLAGYVDEELTPDDRNRVEQHLGDCAICRRGLQAQTLIRARLMRETVSPSNEGLGARVLERIALHEALEAASLEGAPTNRRPGRERLIARAGWLVAATILLCWIGSRMLERSTGAAGGMMKMAPPTLVTIDSNPGPISSAVLNHFERMDQSDLPRGVDLSELENQVPFDVPALRSPHMRFISAWTTQLFGETAAAIAYRCHDRLVIQYVVSEKQFFRNPQVRQAIAEQGMYAGTAGGVSTVAWADLDSGSFLVGEFSAKELAEMRL
jgi:anti-sigma factor RsiW